MTTRSLTYVHDGKNVVLCMYRQADGYPSGHGDDLGQFLKPIKMVNGLCVTDAEKIANGPGCLAAQIVEHFKDGPGGIYLQPTNAGDCGQEYEYHIQCTDGASDVEVKVLQPYFAPNGGRMRMKDKVLFAGNVDDFIKFCGEE